MNFIERIEAHVDEEIDAAGPSARHAARVAVETRNGDRFERHVADRLGSPEKPLPEDRIREKFLENAGATLGKDAVAQLEALLGELEKLEDVSRIAQVCAGQS